MMIRTPFSFLMSGFFCLLCYLTFLSLKDFAQPILVEVIEEELALSSLLELPARIMGDRLPGRVDINSSSEHINRFKAISPEVGYSIDSKKTLATGGFAAHQYSKRRLRQVWKAALLVGPLARWHWLDDSLFVLLHLKWHDAG